MKTGSKLQQSLFERATRVIPGGVNSPVRAFKGVGGTPLFIKKGKGARIWDQDDQSYLDYVGSWGPLIFGHADPEILAALSETLLKGTSFGAATEGEVLLAEKICAMVPSLEKVRLVNSGTEATMSAIRLARAATGRSRIIKFSGCYHGHVDSLLVAAGSGNMTLGVPDSAGVTAGSIADTLVLPYNSLSALEKCFETDADRIAAIIVEPVAGNMGCVLPQNGFLKALRQHTQAHGALLIFDEVMTGFRLAPGGAQEVFGIRPDLTCLGKIIGGGLPVGAFGGSATIMDHLAPVGKAYQAGTLSGNPLAVQAGLAMLHKLSQKGVYQKLEDQAQYWAQGLQPLLEKSPVPVTLNQMGSMFTLFFCEGPVTDYASAKSADSTRFGRFFHELLAQGIYYPPSQFEAAFLSLAHSKADLDLTLSVIEKSLAHLA